MKEEKQEFFQPGLKPVLELLENMPDRVDSVYIRKGRENRDTARIMDLCRDYGVRFNLVGDDVLSRMVPHTGHQGVIARLRDVGFADYEELLYKVQDAPLPLLVALDRVQDPGNVGTLVRTLYALGAAGLVLPKHNSAFLGPGARRSSAGALDKLPIAQVVNLSRAVEQAKDAGLTIYGAQMTPDALNPLKDELRMPALLILGNEESGIRQHVAERCEYSLCIPFRRTFDSLNVAQAGAILTACFARM